MFKSEKMKNKSKFRPCLKPRLLPGSDKLAVIEADLQFYNAHRQKLFSTKSVIDSSPPRMNPYNYLNLRKFEVDANRLDEIERENKDLIYKIKNIHRTRGIVDCWNVFKSTPALVRYPQKIKKIQNDMFENKKMYTLICSAKSVYTRDACRKNWAAGLKRMEKMARYPLVLFDKKTVDQLVKAQPSISGGLGQYGSRPKVYMDFKIKNGICLGEIIIELYIDYAPVTVKNFLAICNSQYNLSYKNCRIHNALKDRYFETGDITQGNGKGSISIYGDDFAEEESPLRHCRQGVVSTVRVKNKEKNARSNSMFSITMSAVNELDGKRAVFGKIIRGNGVICKINDMCKKIGTPLHTIVIARCGEIPLTENEVRKFSTIEQPGGIPRVI